MSGEAQVTRAAARRRLEPVGDFLETHRRVSGRLPGSGAASIDRMRADGLARFAELGMPTTRTELWRYTNIAKWANQPMPLAPAVDLGGMRLSPHFLGGPAARRLIFVNGHLMAQLSHVRGLPAGAVVKSLNLAMQEQPDEVTACAAMLKDERSFSDLNTAFMESGAWIDIGDGVVVDAPLQLLFVTVGNEQPAMAHPRCVIRLGRDARLSIIETHVGIGAGHGLTNMVSQIELGVNSVLAHDRLQTLGEQQSYIGKQHVVMDEGSRIEQTVATLGGGLVRNESEVWLEGSGINAILNGVYMPRGREHADTLIRMHHRAPNSRSDQFFKGVLSDKSHAVFAGKIFVHKEAQQTNAFQKNDNLLLSDDAEVDTKPELEIYADDVKCSHGATCGDLDPASLFYLRSRGMSRDAAESMLTYAFAGDVFERFKDQTARRAAHHAACQRLPGGHTLLDML